MATLALEKLRKTWTGGVDAVKDVDLAIAHGEFVCIVGPSGCGKSTTLNLIAGLDEPTSGRIRIDDLDVTRASPRERDVAMVFQSYALYPHLDVRRNLAFPLEAAGMDRAAIDARVAEAAGLLGLEELLGRRPKELSGGQRQRVALGRALVRRPKLFLFDEPLSNLDAALRTRVRGEIKKLHERLGATFVYVTHDQSEAMTLADRVVVMDRGEVQQVARPREVYDAPSNEFVASFFGSPAINLVPPGILGVPADGAHRVGVRPEHLEVGTGSPPASAVPGRIYLVESMGAESFVTVEREGAHLVARANAEFAGRTGEDVWLRVAEGRTLRFDGDGRRMEGR